MHSKERSIASNASSNYLYQQEPNSKTTQCFKNKSTVVCVVCSHSMHRDDSYKRDEQRRQHAPLLPLSGTAFLVRRTSVFRHVVDNQVVPPLAGVRRLSKLFVHFLHICWFKPLLQNVLDVGYAEDIRAGRKLVPCFVQAVE